MSASGTDSANFDALIDSLKHSATAVVSRDKCIASAAATERTVSELRTEFEKSLAFILRDRNLRTLVGRVPPELWIYVWKFAAFDDMVSIARVCHNWRTLALTNSGLWTSVVVYSSLHHQGCDCDECESSFAHAGDTNFGTARNALLELSKDKPITLTVMAMHWNTNEIFINRLEKCIAACAARLVELNITYDDNLFPSSVLGAVSSFPALRSLTIQPLHLHPRDEPADFLTSAVLFPVLRNLDIGPYLSWPSPGHLEFLLTFPAIQDLTCTFGTQDDIARALSACPATAAGRRSSLAFHWRLHPSDPEIFEMNAFMNAVLDKLDNVRISNISDAQEESVLTTFARAPREFLQLVYMEKSVARGLRACEYLDLAAGLELRLAQIDNAVELTIVDSNQHAVEVAFPASPVGRAAINWAVVPDYLTALTVEVALWDDVLHALPPTPKVKDITLRIADDACLENILPRDNSSPWVFSPDVSLRLEGKPRRYGDVVVHPASVERVKTLLNARTVTYDCVRLLD